ncbi:MAG: DNA translocase FtsK [Deltaproteobacteria bacterium]|nr:MAG: DNA translocase FtsK [Deltaproteobacteria bacterium]
MTVQLSVSQVRKEIYLAAGSPGIEEANQPSTLLLGRMFHESFASLFGYDRRLQWQPVIINADPKIKEWQKNLEDHVYKRLIGPRLGREQAHLHNQTELVVAFWQAAKSMCHWIVELLWRSRRELARGVDPRIKLLTRSQEPLSLEFKEEGWTDAVTLTGIADLVLSVPGRRHWSLVELKLGQTCPEADLTQVCLYHQILSSLHPDTTDALALVEFKPHREEHLFDAVEVKNAQKRLVDLIGRLAGVTSGKKRIREQRKAAFYKEHDPQKCFEQGRQLVSIFREYGTPISLAGDPVSGPSFIRYPVKIGKGLKLGATQGIAHEVQHRMHLSAPPYVHMSEGSGVVDIQRSDRQIVYFSQIHDQLPEADSEVGCSQVLLGIDLYNRLRFADLSDQRNAHILAAGKAGSGKSEWLRSVLAGFIVTNTPDTLRLVLIDPKRNVFNELKGSSFLLSSNTLVYPDEQPAVEVLSRLADEMDRRYRILQNAGVDTRDALIKKFKRTMPRIVCMCDEYFDLINQAPATRKALEYQIFRLGTKSRAVGIHLIIATRQPSRQVIMGALNTNIPARVGFKMGKAVESNMLLNQKGAEYLLDRGDLLFKDIGEPIRLQAPYIVPEQRIKLYQT